MATTPFFPPLKVPAPDRAILEDRWQGLTESPDGSSTEVYLRLILSLRDMAEGVARRPLRDDEALLDGLLSEIHARIIGWAAKE
jgi:hypothetical protein